MIDLVVVTEGARLQEIRDLLREYAAWVGLDLSFQGFDEELAALPGEYVAPRGTLLLGLVDGRAAGCVAVRAWEGETCEMKRLYVSSEARGSGLGRALAARAIAWSREAGYRRMLLDTLPAMTVAQRMYERIGFRDVAAYRANPVPGARFLALDLVARDALPGDGSVRPRA